MCWYVLGLFDAFVLSASTYFLVDYVFRDDFCRLSDHFDEDL